MDPSENQSVLQLPGSLMASLWVGDLPSSVTELMLLEKFGTVGLVHSVRICRDKGRRTSLGYGYVNFHQRTHAEQALECLNYELMEGRPMRIMWSNRDPLLRKNGLGNLYFHNLDESITSGRLHDLLTVFGNVLSCKVVTDDNGISRGFGYVQYDSFEAAERALQRLNGMVLDERKVFIEHCKTWAQLDEQRDKLFTNVFVKNLKTDMDNKKLTSLFKNFGPTLSVRVMRDNHGKSLRFGFVNFKEHQDALKSVVNLNGKVVDGKRLYVGRAKTQKERQREQSLKTQEAQQKLGAPSSAPTPIEELTIAAVTSTPDKELGVQSSAPTPLKELGLATLTSTLDNELGAPSLTPIKELGLATLTSTTDEELGAPSSASNQIKEMGAASMVSAPAKELGAPSPTLTPLKELDVAALTSTADKELGAPSSAPNQEMGAASLLTTPLNKMGDITSCASNSDNSEDEDKKDIQSEVTNVKKSCVRRVLSWMLRALCCISVDEDME